MKIERIKEEKVNLVDFAEKHDLTLVLERTTSGVVFARFKNVYIDNYQPYGSHLDEYNAIINYAKKISLTTLRVEEGPENVREIKAPLFYYDGTTE